MSFEYFIGRRYLKAKRKQAFISLVTILSTAGVAVGVMALIVVIAVMSGFESDLKARILGGQAHIVLKRSEGDLTVDDRLLESVEKTVGVQAAAPFVYSRVMLRTAGGMAGAVLRGIDPQRAGRVIPKLADLTFTPPAASSAAAATGEQGAGIVLGRELARNLGVVKGDAVYLFSARGILSPVGHIPATRRFVVSGFFESGMYDFDGSFAYIDIREARKILRMGERATGIEVRVADLYAADRIGRTLTDRLGADFEAADWMQLNRNLFSALKLEKTAMFVILTLIVLVAAFNIASMLIMMVMEKTRDIAILKTMGATAGSVRRIFIFKGMAVGLVGTALGVGLGLLLCNGLKKYDIMKLTGDIYYFTTTLPVRITVVDVFLIVGAALAICFLATLYPSQQASRLNPVEAIRYG